MDHLQPRILRNYQPRPQSNSLCKINHTSIIPMNQLKKYFIATGLSMLIILPLVVMAGYTPMPPVFDPGGNVERNTLLGNATPVVIVSRIINWVLSLLAIIAVSLIMYAGYLWMAFGGNEEKVGKAREILKGGLFGVTIILGSYGLTNYVFENLINATTK